MRPAFCSNFKPIFDNSPSTFDLFVAGTLGPPHGTWEFSAEDAREAYISASGQPVMRREALICGFSPNHVPPITDITLFFSLSFWEHAPFGDF